MFGLLVTVLLIINYLSSHFNIKTFALYVSRRYFVVELESLTNLSVPHSLHKTDMDIPRPLRESAVLCIDTSVCLHQNHYYYCVASYSILID